jgi:hypothetical protein
VDHGQHQELLTHTRARQLSFFDEDEVDSDDADEDIVPPELLERAEQLDREEYDVAEILADTFLDLDQIATAPR